MAKILISYRGIKQSPGWATGDLVVNAFRSLGHEVDVYGTIYQGGKTCAKPDRIKNSLGITEVRKKEFDLALYMEMNDPDYQYSELKYIPAKIRAYWDFDVSYHPHITEALLNYMKFDHIFCANANFKNLFEKHGKSSLLPYAFCPDKHMPRNIKPFNERDYQFAMIGSAWPGRKRIVGILKDNDINVHLIEGKFREEYIEALNNTQCSINYNVDKGRGLLVMRIWETLATSSCLITNDGDYLEDYICGGKDCFIYKDDNDLINICKKINKNIGMAAAVARHGNRTGYWNHTYQNRAISILRTFNMEPYVCKT